MAVKRFASNVQLSTHRIIVIYLYGYMRIDIHCSIVTIHYSIMYTQLQMFATSVNFGLDSLVHPDGSVIMKKMVYYL